MIDKSELVDAATVAVMLNVTPAYVRMLAARGVFQQRGTRYTRHKGRPAALYNVHEVMDAWEKRKAKM